MAEKRSILCFGDSLTWGWIPVKESAPTLRYPYEQRWTGAMAARLGDGYHIIEEGLSARTTSLDDPNDPRLNGSTYLPAALASHLPLDLVILMLGTNDTKSYFHRTPYEIANGMGKLVGQVLTSAGGVGTPYPAPRVLVVAPPPAIGDLDPFEGVVALFDRRQVAVVIVRDHLVSEEQVDAIDPHHVADDPGSDIPF